MKVQVVEALCFEVGERVLTRWWPTRLFGPLAYKIRYHAVHLFLFFFWRLPAVPLSHVTLITYPAVPLPCFPLTLLCP